MTTQPKTIDSPLLGTTWVAVNRGVLVELLRFMDTYSEFEWPDIKTRQRIYDIGQAVEQGRIDVLDAATFRGTQDPS